MVQCYQAVRAKLSPTEFHNFLAAHSLQLTRCCLDAADTLTAMPLGIYSRGAASTKSELAH